MPEAVLIKNCISRDKKTAYHRAKNSGGAYTVRGNSIVRTESNGSVVVVKNIKQVKVRLKKEDRVVVLK